MLREIFRNPISGTIDWSDIELLLMTVGADIIEGSGSRVRFVVGEFVLYIHRPHPRKEALKYHVRDVRKFLNGIGIRP